MPAESPDRNDDHAWKSLVQPLCEKGILKPEQFIRPGEPVDALDYTETVFAQIPSFLPLSNRRGDRGEASGGSVGIDIGIFGLGPDGHIASLFPGHPALDVQTEGYIRIHEAPKLPPERISLTALSVEDIPHTCLFAV